MKLRTLINIILMAFIIWLFPALINNLFNLTAEPFEECTSAVIGRWAVADGRALLWKNRDTEVADNKIVFLNEGPLQALALVNADSLASVWMGVNEAGFAIINTASEDLEGSSSSQNGSFQKKALLNCRTVEEFEVLLQQTNKSGRATKANYGVIDATGAAAYFETGNHTYARFDVGSSGFLVRTNFAFTGDGTGTGKFRYDRAFQLISEGIASQAISPEFILRQVARDLVNDVLNPYPLPYPYGQDGLPAGFIRTVNSINRYRTRSAVVFQGVRPGEEPILTSMWVMMGEPVCTIG
ncbi:MAG: carcinine hydrolase/isopenicillin-N N-acyltransferase family protein, partial [Candidatus Aminicenantes bacterium]|nr:carcinine hydrolase/isopenicillin-N N-acyltransferase family protein [Candidatus Aminicenantes bacterium]